MVDIEMESDSLGASISYERDANKIRRKLLSIDMPYYNAIENIIRMKSKHIKQTIPLWNVTFG